ncbi:LysR substrate-binding domain-containing protein [Psychromonas arctica]|uniref:LysR substrate-binding domain-containing protein n=1 Tax=Psychromonas arctica TaxID=168275 RepID=A0ABU9HBD5_9GAMM
MSGKGIAYRSKIDISEDLRNGKLIQLLANYQSPSVELHLICPSRKQVTPAVIAFRELLRERLK